MADKGIIFSAAMVRALLAARKTQTRRLLKARYGLPSTVNLAEHGVGSYSGLPNDPASWGWPFAEDGSDASLTHFPDLSGYRVGDRLYVRESYFQFGHWEPVEGKLTKGGRQKWGFIGVQSMVKFEEPADYLTSRSKFFPGAPRWYKRLGRFMPRNLSRMWLAVTDVRVQRLQECSNEDAQAEGREICASCGDSGWVNSGPDGGWQCDVRGCGDEDREWYAELWNNLHTAEGERWDDNPWVVAVTFEVRQGNIDGGRAA